MYLRALRSGDEHVRRLRTRIICMVRALSVSRPGGSASAFCGSVCPPRPISRQNTSSITQGRSAYGILGEFPVVVCVCSCYFDQVAQPISVVGEPC